MSQLQMAKIGRKAAVAIDRSIEMEMESEARRGGMHYKLNNFPHTWSATSLALCVSVCALREI